jgi:membrane fusion protein (multidrug efflux system)
MPALTTELKTRNTAPLAPATADRPATRAKAAAPIRETEPASIDEASQQEPEPLVVKNAQARPPKRLKRWLTMGLVAAVLLGAGSYGWSYWQWAQVHVSTDNAFIDGHIVQVSSRVMGHVARVYVDDNQVVHKGDLLVELDPADFAAALAEAAGKLAAAQADLTAARSAVVEAQSQVAASEASVAQAKAEAASRNAELQRATEDLAQYTRARSSGGISATEWAKIETQKRTAQAAYDAAQKAVAAAEAQVSESRAVIESRQGQVAVADAQIKAAQAAVDKAQLNLSYTKITAATDGRITRKSVEPGNFLIPGQPVLAIVEPDVWVTANFKETQLAHMKPGQQVEMEVDAYPGMKLHGHVDSIQQGAGARFSLLPPENATGNYVKVVQRVPVKIVPDELPADGRILGPGMSVVPIVETK